MFSPSKGPVTPEFNSEISGQTQLISMELQWSVDLLMERLCWNLDTQIHTVDHEQAALSASAELWVSF